MANIQFNPYSPKEEQKKEELIDITLGVFFDGTLNNKNNTDERKKNSAVFQNEGKDKDEDTSYYNDWSNVARLWDNYDKAKSIYIEGIGTEDNKSDTTQGYAFGTGTTGVRGKVRKGCEKVVTAAKEVAKNKKSKTINTLTLDVFGFSRGAAAARNFVYEINKAKYKPTPVNHSKNDFAEPVWVDSDGYSTTLQELPKRGHLGLKLKEAGIEVTNVVVRFLGIFDTVSSYGGSFKNDIEDLSLDSIQRAKSIIHFIAEDEHRENFALTNVNTGIEKKFPGVHSDIGGGYESGIETIEELETDWTNRNDLEPFRKQLIDQGWYKEDQLKYTGGNFYFALEGKRDLKKTYSYVPLHFMAKYGVLKELPINTNKIENMKYSISNDPLLVRVKNRLEPYVMGDGAYYSFKWFKDIHKKYESNKSSPNYQKELNEQQDLRALRNGYLHWSAKREGIGMDPTSDRKRVVY
ncbi:DUF2235 domain-containing protein [Flavobacterium sp. H122]|uniref:T6SS phospholipase effector Tle1-like catalytic domain-containing protein n=1 Tax=Flavobacterium sp. H122 TaxID=2529860 RepID=UPI0010AA9ED1|nr:DUF2235 domain-containing protein [Flavobacterium sp. H122]